MVDRYTKAVLTIIAMALLWLCFLGPAPSWMAPAEAQSGTVDVNIARLGGKRIQVNLLTSFDGISSVNGLPVEIRGQ